MLDILLIVFLPLVALGFFTVYRIKPEWLKVDVGLWRSFTFGMEIGRPEKVREKQKEIEPGEGDVHKPEKVREKQKEIEPGEGDVHK